MSRISFLFCAILASHSLLADRDPFLGEIIWGAFDFAPKGFAECNGQLLPINPNSALFSLLGTQFGGNGTTTFALPDMRGRAPIHMGTGPGLTERFIGSSGGVENVTLTENQLPSHDHTAGAHTASGIHDEPSVSTFANDINSYSSGTPSNDLNECTVTETGGNEAHNNMPPFIALKCFIALSGDFPSLP